MHRAEPGSEQSYSSEEERQILSTAQNLTEEERRVQPLRIRNTLAAKCARVRTFHDRIPHTARDWAESTLQI